MTMSDNLHLPILQLIFVSDTKDRSAESIRKKVLQVFGHNVEVESYLVTSEDMGVAVKHFDFGKTLEDSTNNTLPVGALDAALHTMVILLLNDEFNKNHSLIRYAADLLNEINLKDAKHYGLIASTDLHQDRGVKVKLWADKFIGSYVCFQSPTELRLQTMAMWQDQAGSLGKEGNNEDYQPKVERDVAGEEFALFAASKAQLMIRAGTSDCELFKPVEKNLEAGKKERVNPLDILFFVSHAKADGMPLAQTIGNAIANRSWFDDFFYDAVTIKKRSEAGWTIDMGIQSAIVLVARTNRYSDRYWCRVEVIKADQYGRPIITIDARTDLVFGVDFLPLSQSKGLSIKDGNVLRILSLAASECVRSRLFARNVAKLAENGKLQPFDSDRIGIFYTQPSPTAIQRWLNGIKDQAVNHGCILYPEPAIAGGAYEAAKALIQASKKNVSLHTPSSLIMEADLS